MIFTYPNENAYIGLLHEFILTFLQCYKIEILTPLFGNVRALRPKL
jgi:hypothetical protein